MTNDEDLKHNNESRVVERRIEEWRAHRLKNDRRSPTVDDEVTRDGVDAWWIVGCGQIREGERERKERVRV